MPLKYTKEDIINVGRRYRQGHSAVEISRNMGISYPTVRLWLRKMFGSGLPKNKPNIVPDRNFDEIVSTVTSNEETVNVLIEENKENKENKLEPMYL